MRRFQKLLLKIMTIWNVLCLTAAFQVKTYAMTVNPDITVDDFNKVTGDNVAGMLLGITFWFCRLFGVIVIMWGIYSVIVAKRDGDADAISISIVKLIFGAVLLGMPNILKALEIIQF